MGTVSLVVPGVKVIGSVVNVPVEIKASVVVMDINIKTSTIMVPIDLQGAYIMMPVDIQAQYMNLAIDIVAQTIGNIGIDIKAQTLSQLNVNIAASAVTLNVSVTGTAQVSITAQTVGVYLQPEWSAKTGVDKNFTVASTNVAYGGSAYGLYTVTTGKTLYLCGASFYLYSYASANGDANQIGYIELRNVTTGILLGTVGGNGGGGINFAKPLSLTAGQQLRYEVFCYANHATNIGMTVWGYEI